MLIRESFELAIVETAAHELFNPDGSIDMVLIRPCHGRGAGSRIYEADMLAEHASALSGVPMYDNHDSPAAKKARAGLPRAPSEVAGFVREARWDPEYTTPEDASMGFGTGAVIGRCVLTDVMEALVRKMPEVVKTSVAAQATDLKLTTRNGRKGWLVEGIVNDPENTSVDLVTRAGAGGRVRALLESLADDDHLPDMAVLETVDDDQLTAWLTEHRPTILDSLGGNMGLNLQEALQTDEVKGYINGMIAEAVEVERETMRDEIRDELAATGRIRALSTQAKGLIEAAKGIGKTAKADLLEAYAVTDGDDDTVTPGRSLALIEAEVDAEGKVTKPARKVLEEAIEGDIKRIRNIVRESAPSVPITPGTGRDSQTATARPFGAPGSAFGDKIRAKGLDPALFGVHTPKEN